MIKGRVPQFEGFIDHKEHSEAWHVSQHCTFIASSESLQTLSLIDLTYFLYVWHLFIPCVLSSYFQKVKNEWNIGEGTIVEKQTYHPAIIPERSIFIVNGIDWKGSSFLWANPLVTKSLFDNE